MWELKEQAKPISGDLVETLARRDLAIWSWKNPRPTAIHGRNYSSLVFDQGLKQIRTGHPQISHVFSTSVDSQRIVAQWHIDPTPPKDKGQLRLSRDARSRGHRADTP
jgi:hypothetical protein